MKTLLLMALCAISVTAQAVEEKRDTVDKYVINYNAIENFDGSQLVGKQVQDYTIVYKRNGNIVEKRHEILTITVSKEVIVVDGKEVLAKNLTEINPKNIVSMTILKPSSDAAKANVHGPGKVIIVETKKKDGGAKAKPYIIVNGYESTLEKLSAIKNEDILHIVNLDPGSSAAKTYGEKGKGGVIIVTTKSMQK